MLRRAEVTRPAAPNLAVPGIAASLVTAGSPRLSIGLFAWWRRQIWSLLPGLARLQPAPEDAVIIDIHGFSPDPDIEPGVTGDILTRRSGQERIAARLDDSQACPVERQALDLVILRLPQEMVLHREMTLPFAAERDLPALIHFQMPQLTPFEATEVFWGISSPIRGETRLQLTLYVVQRDLIERIRNRLARTGLEPSVIEAAGAGIALASLANRKTPLRITRSGICAILAIACLLIPLMGQQLQLQATERRLDNLRPVQRQIMQLNAEASGLTLAQHAIDQDPAADMVRTLAILTSALPDGTWLNDLTVNGQNVTFDGQSNDAAHLIAVLSATPGLRDVSFSAPVTRAAAGGTDAFSIQLSMAR